MEISTIPETVAMELIASTASVAATFAFFVVPVIREQVSGPYPKYWMAPTHVKFDRCPSVTLFFRFKYDTKLVEDMENRPGPVVCGYF